MSDPQDPTTAETVKPVTESNWGAWVFYGTLVVLLVFFWWLLIESGGVSVQHG